MPKQSLAEQCFSQIVRWEAVVKQPIVKANFEDGSVASISIDPRKQQIGTSGAGTLAFQFADSLQRPGGFRVTAEGLEFTFKDDSVFGMKLDGATTDHTGGPSRRRS